MDFSHKDLNKTLWVKPEYMEKNRKWFTIDATGKTLGRLAVEVAKHISGKNKPHLCGFWDCGDFVVVTNVDKVETTGYKKYNKMYYRYSGYKGNLKSTSLEDMMKKNPEKVLWLAVRGMLPKNKMRKRMMKRLKLFKGTTDKYNHLHPEALA